MADYDPTKWLGLPGNDTMTFVVDLVSFRRTAFQANSWVVFNRDIGGLSTSVVLCEYGEPPEPYMVSGSVKSGIPLKRPRWVMPVTAVVRTMGSPNCGGTARLNIMSKSGSEFTSPCWISWRLTSMTVGERLMLTPIFTWAGVYNDVAGSPCA